MKLKEIDRTNLARILNELYPDKEWHSLRREQRRDTKTFLCLDGTFATKYTDRDAICMAFRMITTRSGQLKKHETYLAALQEKLNATSTSNDEGKA